MRYTDEKILKTIEKQGNVRVYDLVRELKLSRQAIHKHVLELHDSGAITKIGTPPKVYYRLADSPASSGRIAESGADPFYSVIAVDSQTRRIINENYLYVDPQGKFSQGMEGFTIWCSRNKLPVAKTAKEYVKTLEKYKAYSRNGLINGIDKLKRTFKDVFLDKLYYASFYSIERFGKTLLGQYLLYAKQSQNRKLIEKVAQIVKPQIEKIIKLHKIDTVIFVPPTVKREVQFMKEFEYYLGLILPKIKVEKIKNEIAVPQKTLSNLADRIENAESTFIVPAYSGSSATTGNILLIDDAVGSGATFNTIAQKLRKGGVKGKIIGFSVTGSFKGFDVISEV